MSDAEKAIIFVPGIRPKPPVELHREALWQCLVAGVRRADSEVADALQGHLDSFHVVGWSYQFYGEHGRIEDDQSGIRQLLTQNEPSSEDLQEAGGIRRRFRRLVYAVGDRFPLVSDLLATRSVELRMNDIRRYFADEGGVAAQIRDLVTEQLMAAWSENRQVMLIGHSFGSVIAYDTLWELSRQHHVEHKVDMFISMGSPLGLSFVNKGVKGRFEQGQNRFPDNITNWLNVSAKGEVTAHHPHLAEMMRQMQQLGLLEHAIDHLEVVNFFRNQGNLNVHKCYGYFANVDTGKYISDWWCRQLDES
jgi:pimeloyl-ACP methyl ester carboxylesterase